MVMGGLDSLWNCWMYWFVTLEICDFNCLDVREDKRSTVFRIVLLWEKICASGRVFEGLVIYWVILMDSTGESVGLVARVDWVMGCSLWLVVGSRFVIDVLMI